MRLGLVIDEGKWHIPAWSSTPTTRPVSTGTTTRRMPTTTGTTTCGTTTRSWPSGTARNRFQPPTQHASDLHELGIELLVGVVGHTFAVFR